jgi:hypothetical protein
MKEFLVIINTLFSCESLVDKKVDLFVFDIRQIDFKMVK